MVATLSPGNQSTGLSAWPSASTTGGPRGLLVGSFLLNTPLGLLLGWLQGALGGADCSLLLEARAVCGLLLVSFWRASRASRMLSSSLVSFSEKCTRGAALCGLMCVCGLMLRSDCGLMLRKEHSTAVERLNFWARGFLTAPDSQPPRPWLGTAQLVAGLRLRRGLRCLLLSRLGVRRPPPPCRTLLTCRSFPFLSFAATRLFSFCHLEVHELAQGNRKETKEGEK